VSGQAQTSPSRRRPDPALVVFAAALVATGVMLLVWFGDLTFWRDEWGFLLHRRGSDPGVYLHPHYEHIAISLIAVYKALLAVFGMDSPRPFQLVATLTFLTSVALMFVYVRRCVGSWVALASALPILVLGPAWDDLLWPFQTGFFASMSAGLGALLLLERKDRLGDIVACALLVIAISFSSLGLPFTIGVAVHVGWDRERLRRAYIAAVPLAVYALWWLGWGHEADNYASLHNLVTLPSYILDGFASSLSSLLGLATPRDVVASPLDWGRALLAGALALAVWRLLTLGRVSRSLCALAATAVSFWALAGFNASIFREPTSGRYQYMGAIFVVVIAAELLRGVRIPRSATIAAIAVAVLAALSNLHQLHTNYQGLTSFGRLQPAGLAALELTRDVVDPSFELIEENSDVDYLGFVDAAAYLSAVDAFGSPAYTPAELAASAEDAREAADKVFAAALELRLRPADAGAASDRCSRLSLGREPATVEVGPGGASFDLAPGSTLQVQLRRYASERFPVRVGRLRGSGAATLAIPPDRSSEPWELGLSGSGGVSVCGLGGA
jgi:hypothetical protein